MAQPTHSVTPTEYRYDLAGTYADGPCYLYSVMRVPRMPSRWHVDNEDNDLFKLGLSWCAKITDATEDLEYIVQMGNKAPVATGLVGPQATSTWLDADDPIIYHDNDDPTKVQYPRGYSFDNENNSTDEEKYRYVVIIISMESESETGPADNLYLYALHHECIDDDASDQDNFNYFDGEGYHPVTASAAQTNTDLIAADNPCSAYHVMWLLCDNYEIFLHRNKPQFTVPVFGDDGYVAP